MKIHIRSAVPGDGDFLAWVMLSATRSHLKYGAWEHYVGGTERDCLTFLKNIAETKISHLFHYSTFFVAEIEGKKAGALSGYDPRASGFPVYLQAQQEVFQKLGWTEEAQKAAFKRHIPFLACTPKDTEGAWVVESVAVLPEFRRKGVLTVLLSEVLDKGRKNGYTLAQIGVLIDNTPARSAYEKQGFTFNSQKTNPEFDVIFGSPGIAKLILEL